MTDQPSHQAAIEDPAMARAPLVAIEDRQATLKVEIIGFQEAPRGRVSDDLAHVRVLETCDELGLDKGAEIMVQMNAHAEDDNWVLHNMIRGDNQTKTPECGAGSVVTFTGCSLQSGQNVVQATSFEVIDAHTPAAGMRM